MFFSLKMRMLWPVTALSRTVENDVKSACGTIEFWNLN